MRRSRRLKSLPKDPVSLEIEKLSHDGRGIAHLDGKVVFVSEALPGERVKAVYTSKRDSFDEAKTLEVLRPSVSRVDPECQYASICGGCSFQHFDSAAQLAFKETVLHEKLQHSIGNDDYRKLPAITGPSFHYRRKARLGVRFVRKKNQVLVGFREKNSSFITQMDSCSVLDSQVSDLLVDLGRLIQSLISFQRIPQIEVAVGDKLKTVNSLALVIRHLQALPQSDIDKLRDFAAQHRLDIYLQPEGPESVTKLYPAETESRLYYQLQDFQLTLGFHPMDFTQVNAEINKKMLVEVIDLLDLKKSDRVLDLFCGLGNFTLPLATRAAAVVGVEGVVEMVARGIENAERNNIKNVSFYAADLARPIIKKEWMAEKFEKVLIDPPRSGALEILADIAACSPEKIVYISCNPATLARDAGVLGNKGYTLLAAGVLDMFPQTAHVESIALFEPAV